MPATFIGHTATTEKQEEGKISFRSFVADTTRYLNMGTLTVFPGGTEIIDVPSLKIDLTDDEKSLVRSGVYSIQLNVGCSYQDGVVWITHYTLWSVCLYKGTQGAGLIHSKCLAGTIP